MQRNQHHQRPTADCVQQLQNFGEAFPSLHEFWKLDKAQIGRGTLHRKAPGIGGHEAKQGLDDQQRIKRMMHGG